LVVLGFELKPLHLLSRCFGAWATPSAPRVFEVGHQSIVVWFCCLNNSACIVMHAFLIKSPFQVHEEECHPPAWDGWIIHTTRCLKINTSQTSADRRITSVHMTWGFDASASTKSRRTGGVGLFRSCAVPEGLVGRKEVTWNSTRLHLPGRRLHAPIPAHLYLLRVTDKLLNSSVPQFLCLRIRGNNAGLCTIPKLKSYEHSFLLNPRGSKI
jgi:hypothetical protein